MKPWETVDRATAPDGTELILARRDDEWVVREAGRVLMSSRMHGSEEALASFALERVPHPPRSVLIGGLGLGFTLRATLDRLGPDAKVVVAEMVPELVAWNRGLVADLAGRPLDDPRVRLHMGDIAARIREAQGAYDAILLDVDNGPSMLNHAANGVMYETRGIRQCRDALRPGGVLAVWSAGVDDAYVERLQRVGFTAEARIVPGRGTGQGGVRHVIFLGTRPPPRRGAKPPDAPPARGGPAARRGPARRPGPPRRKGS